MFYEACIATWEALGNKRLFWLGTFLLLVYVTSQKYLAYYTNPLRKQGVPGPFLARFTNLYRFYYVMRRNWHHDLVRLHEKYGPVVWIAPDEISVSDPRLKSVIYGFADYRKEKSFFKKSPAFETGQINMDLSLLFEMDPARARKGKKTVAHFYSEKGLRNLETCFDKTVDELVDSILVHHVASKKDCDFTLWSNLFMMDLITHLACNYSGGLLQAGKDIKSTTGGVRYILDIVGSLMPYPFALQITTRWIRKLLVLKALEQVFRASLCFSPEVSKEERINRIVADSPENLLARFYKSESDVRPLYHYGNQVEGVTNHLFNLIAGTVGVTSIALASVIRQLLRHPDVLRKVREELSALGEKVVPISAFQHQEGTPCQVPYLEAVVLETIRVQPLLGISLSRVVPADGCMLNQYSIPPGYLVGMSAFPVNRNKDYFGPDASEFKPERWLGNHPTEMSKDGSGLSRTMRHYIEAGWMTFGAGSRVCIGRHLAEISLMKSVSALVQAFDIEMVKAPAEVCSFNINLDGMVVRFTPRVNAQLQQA